MDSIVKRLKQYIEIKGISVSVAEKEIGTSNGSLSKPFKSNTTIKTDTLEKFLKRYLDINPSWLLMGNGNMLTEIESLKGINDIQTKLIEFTEKEKQIFDLQLQQLKQENTLQYRTIELYKELNTELKFRIETIENENAQLKAKLSGYESQESARVAG